MDRPSTRWATAQGPMGRSVSDRQRANKMDRPTAARRVAVIAGSDLHFSECMLLCSCGARDRHEHWVGGTRARAAQRAARPSFRAGVVQDGERWRLKRNACGDALQRIAADFTLCCLLPTITHPCSCLRRHRRHPTTPTTTAATSSRCPTRCQSWRRCQRVVLDVTTAVALLQQALVQQHLQGRLAAALLLRTALATRRRATGPSAGITLAGTMPITTAPVVTGRDLGLCTTAAVAVQLGRRPRALLAEAPAAPPATTRSCPAAQVCRLLCLLALRVRVTVPKLTLLRPLR